MSTPGARLGPYEIVELIGSGGMGQVFKALDTRIGRSVAIKVAKSAYGDRLLAEMRAIAALNHPNVCSLYDVGPDYLVMEFLEGRPLSGPLPWSTAFEYACQVLDALDAAHKRGIVHRDLKPANILVTSAGIKLLDFGLAKTTAVTQPGATQSLSLTAPNTVVGTPQYMAPEQIEGKDADARTDIFAFGCLLYELLEGKPPFRGDTAQRVVASILSAPAPPMDGLPAPDGVGQIIAACLEKSPDHRWQNVRDIKLALRGAAARPSRPVLVKKSRWLLAGTALTMAGLGAAVMFWLNSGRPAPPQQMFELAPPLGARSIDELSISPDGRLLAMAADRRLWIRVIETGALTLIQHSEGAGHPFWSPDSKSVAFFTSGRLKRVSASGGEPVDLASSFDPGRGAWWQNQNDGLIVYSPGTGVPLLQVAQGGGSARPLTALGVGETGHMNPAFLPDGRLLFSATGPGGGVRLAVLKPGGLADSRLLIPAVGLQGYANWGRTGMIAYTADQLMVRQFNPGSGQLVGEAFPVATKDTVFRTAPRTISIAETGTAVMHVQRNWVPKEIHWVTGAGKDPVIAVPRGYHNNLRISPDGSRVAFAAAPHSAGQLDVHVYDLNRRTSTRLSSTPEADGVPVWSPDGREVAFASWRDGVSNLYIAPADASTPDRPLLRSNEAKYPDDWSPDGRTLLMDVADAQTGWDLWLLPLPGKDAKPVPFLKTPFNERDARFSADGQWVAYTSDETGRPEVYIQSFPLGKGKWQISTNGGAKPAWDGRDQQVFYLDAEGSLQSVKISVTAGRLAPGQPAFLFRTDALPEGFGPQFDYDPKTHRFLIVTRAERPAPVLVLNWRPSFLGPK